VREILTEEPVSMSAAAGRPVRGSAGTRRHRRENVGPLKVTRSPDYDLQRPRLMASRAAAGLSEIRRPELIRGSLDHARNVNPVIPESRTQALAQLIGNGTTAITVGACRFTSSCTSSAVLARNLWKHQACSPSASRLLTRIGVQGIEANRERRSTPRTDALTATALNPYIG